MDSHLEADRGTALRRLLDLSDEEWLRERCGADAVKKLRKTRKEAFFSICRDLDAEGKRFVQRRLQARSASLDAVVRFEATFRWRLFLIRAEGTLHFLGVNRAAAIWKSYAGVADMMQTAVPQMGAA